MFDTDNIIPIQIELLDGQIDIILRALELYSFNLHNTWGLALDDNLNELRNALVFHTYQSLLAQKKKDYKIIYDLEKEYNLDKNRKRKKAYYIAKKNIA